MVCVCVCESAELAQCTVPKEVHISFFKVSSCCGGCLVVVKVLLDVDSLVPQSESSSQTSLYNMATM